MVKYAESMLKLQELLQEEANVWRAGPLVISIATSLTNDNPIELDFSKTIGHGKYKPRKPSDSNCYWLPKNINENNDEFREKIIHPIFVQACYRAGFNIEGKWVKKDACILFFCNRGRFHNQDKNNEHYEKKTRNVKDKSKPPVSRDNKTERPIKEDGEETCKFDGRD